MSKGLRISFVLPVWSGVPVGGYKVVFEYANRLVSYGYQINMILPLGLYHHRDIPRKTSIHKLKIYLRNRFGKPPFDLPTLNWFDLSPKVNLSIVPTLEEIYIPRSDVIFATSWHTAEWVNSYRSNKGKKFYFIQSFETWSGPEEDVINTWKMPLKKIVIAKWLKDTAVKLNEEILAYIPNGIDLSVFKITTRVEDRDPKRIGMIYHHQDSVKGSQDGIEALKIVRQNIPDISVAFFSVCQKGHNVPDWVEFHYNPPLETICELYNSFSIFISPSLIEGWPLPPAEAMACGCALVSTDIPGIKEYAVHDDNALLSPSGHPKELANNIMKLLNNQEKRLSLAVAGNKHIQQFDVNRAALKLAEVIEREI